MKRTILHLINFALILAFMITICVVEDRIVKTSLEKVEEYCYEIEALAYDATDLRTRELALLVDNLAYEWKIDESNMCFLVDHKSVQEIGTEIVRLKNYITENEIIEFKISLELIRNYTHTYLHFMGASWHNVL